MSKLLWSISLNNVLVSLSLSFILKPDIHMFCVLLDDWSAVAVFFAKECRCYISVGMEV